MSELHTLVGTMVIVLNLIAGLGLALTPNRPQAQRWFGYVALLGFGSLALQLALGADLWTRGLRPSSSPLGEIHVAGPALAFLLYLLALTAGRRGNARLTTTAAALATAAVALISYGIGEMG